MNINKQLAQDAANSIYGASMGRRSFYYLTQGAKVYCQRVTIDSQGYDRGGAYWGIGQQLYCVFQPEGDLRVFVRADSNKQAKDQVMGEFNK